MKRWRGIGIAFVFLDTAVYGVLHAECSGGPKMASHHRWRGGSESDEKPELRGNMYYDCVSRP